MLSDDTMLIKSVTASVAQRNEVISDIAKQKINYETIAAMLDVFRSTISNVLRRNTSNILKNNTERTLYFGRNSV